MKRDRGRGDRVAERCNGGARGWSREEALWESVDGLVGN